MVSDSFKDASQVCLLVNVVEFGSLQQWISCVGTCTPFSETQNRLFTNYEYGIDCVASLVRKGGYRGKLIRFKKRGEWVENSGAYCAWLAYQYAWESYCNYYSRWKTLNST